MKLLRDMSAAQLRELMHGMGEGLERTAAAFDVEIPKYAVIVFSDPESSQYASNCDRQLMVAVLREVADRLEGKREGGTGRRGEGETNQAMEEDAEMR